MDNCIKLIENETSIKSTLRDNTRKSMYIIGDSHTWGEGSLGQSDGYNTAHAVFCGSRGYANRLKEDLYNAWGTAPVRFVPTWQDENHNIPEYINEETYTSPLKISTGRACINMSYGLPQDSQNINWWTNANKNSDLYSYNSVIGFYDKSVLDCEFTPNKNVFAIGKQKFTIDAHFADDFIADCDFAGRYGITKPLLSFNDEYKVLSFVCVRTMPESFARNEGKQIFIEFSTGKTIPVILHVVKPINSKEWAICFSLMDGSYIEKSQLAAVFEEEYDIAKIYDSIAPTILIPIEKPQRLISFHLMSSINHNCDVRVSVLGDMTASGKPELALLKRTSDDEMEEVNYEEERIIKDDNEEYTYFTIDCSNLNEKFYVLSSDRPIAGILEIEAINKFKGYKSNQGSNMFSTRGVILGNMNKIILAGMGCHSVGNWIGTDADICGHAGGLRNHICEYKQTELIHIKEKRMALVQAPIVNEYLRQTSIYTYNENLTKLFVELDIYSENMLIFVATGQCMVDEVYGGIPESGKISYSDYRKATKEWAKENNITFIDISIEISKLVQTGVPITDFVMKNDDGTFDSNHPSHFSNMIWYETLKPYVIRKFA